MDLKMRAQEQDCNIDEKRSGLSTATNSESLPLSRCLRNVDYS